MSQLHIQLALLFLFGRHLIELMVGIDWTWHSLIQSDPLPHVDLILLLDGIKSTNMAHADNESMRESLPTTNYQISQKAIHWNWQTGLGENYALVYHPAVCEETETSPPLESMEELLEQSQARFPPYTIWNVGNVSSLISTVKGPPRQPLMYHGERCEETPTDTVVSIDPYMQRFLTSMPPKVLCSYFMDATEHKSGEFSDPWPVQLHDEICEWSGLLLPKEQLFDFHGLKDSPIVKAERVRYLKSSDSVNLERRRQDSALQSSPMFNTSEER